MAPVLAGAARVPISGLPARFGLAGFGTDSVVAAGTSAPLHVRCVLLDDQRGQRLCWCVADLHSGTRIVLVRAAERLVASGVIFAPAQLVLSGTHTHAGPAYIYGASLYDALAGPLRLSGRHEPAIVSSLVDAVVQAATLASHNLGAASLKWHEGVALGVAMQRSQAAFPSFQVPWGAAGAPGQAVAGTQAWATDPRLPVLNVTRPGGQQVATVAVFSCHNTALGNGDRADPDWFGHAMAQMEQRRGGVAMLAVGAAGDVSPLSPSVIHDWSQARASQGQALAVARGDALAAAWQRTLASPGQVASSLTVRMSDLGRDVRGRGRGQLSAVPRFGVPTLAGTEDYRPAMASWASVYEGARRRHACGRRGCSLQHPKVSALGLFQRLLVRRRFLDLHDDHPVHLVQVGDRALVFLPGEPTLSVGWRIERRLRRDLPGTRPVILGCAGDYMGYITTPQEYRRQHYEGSSTLYGRHTFAVVDAVVQGLRRGEGVCVRLPHERQRPSVEAAVAFEAASVDDPVLGRIRVEPCVKGQVAPGCAQVDDRVWEVGTDDGDGVRIVVQASGRHRLIGAQRA